MNLNNEQKKQFAGYALHELERITREAGLSLDESVLSVVHNRMIANFAKDSAEYIQSENTFTRLMDTYSRWLERQDLGIADDSQLSYKVEITRHYGTLSVTFGLTEVPTTVPSGLSNIHWANLQAKVEQRFRTFEAFDLQRLLPPGVASDRQEATQTGTETTIPCTKLSMNIQNGITQFRVHGGAWEKFGVPLYPEVAEAAGFNQANIPLEGVDLKGYKARVMMNGEKPKKVLELYRS